MSKVLTEVKEQDIWADNFQGRMQTEYKSPEAVICRNMPQCAGNNLQAGVSE